MKKPIKVKVTFRQQTPEEERQFLAALDALIEELVRRKLEQLRSQKPLGNAPIAPNHAPEETPERISHRKPF